MIECNANGIGGFALLLQKFFHWIIYGSKDWVVYLGILVISNVKSVREWVKKSIHQYFIEKDLSSQELNKQVHTLKTVMKAIQVVIGLFFIRYLFKTCKKMLA
mmetsp:Transcript_18924/g.16764  ORF Transcript_18924/g.16764 Transcript_18924/m.16764 type:complete len:103 (-) Transcript_18924:50-358(-)